MKAIKIFLTCTLLGFNFISCNDTSEEKKDRDDITNSNFISLDTLADTFFNQDANSVKEFISLKGFQQVNKIDYSDTLERFIYAKTVDLDTLLFDLWVSDNDEINELTYYISDQSQDNLINIFKKYTDSMNETYPSWDYTREMLIKGEDDTKKYNSHTVFMKDIDNTALSSIYFVWEYCMQGDYVVSVTYAPMEIIKYKKFVKSNEQGYRIQVGIRKYK